MLLHGGLVVLVAVFGWSRCGFGLAPSRIMKNLGAGRGVRLGVRRFLYEVARPRRCKKQGVRGFATTGMGGQ